MDPFIGQITMFAGNFAPRGWALCDGQLLRISHYSALFSILGTTYGGDGVSTFALPDLRGRAPIHVGQGPGLTQRHLGERGGAEAVTLTVQELPAHNHLAVIAKGAAGGATPSFEGQLSATTQVRDEGIQQTGGGQPHDNMPPFGVVSYIIALEGTFPSRG